jgi:hypothetical protein
MSKKATDVVERPRRPREPLCVEAEFARRLADACDPGVLTDCTRWRSPLPSGSHHGTYPRSGH